MNYNDKVIEAFKTNQPDTELTMEDAKLLISMLMSKDENLDKCVNDLDKSSEI